MHHYHHHSQGRFVEVHDDYPRILLVLMKTVVPKTIVPVQETAMVVWMVRKIEESHDQGQGLLVVAAVVLLVVVVAAVFVVV